ncbi:MAG TPA: ATP-dependent Clp protease proteolytic subunit [Azospirillaceae bacterium]|nr:ATP-dependent Clp protease proteolytic subunit [Azospirillaceae bacterium]
MSLHSSSLHSTSQSADAYVSYIRPVTMESVAGLLEACQTAMSEGARRIHLAIGSGGGNIIAGLSAYNQLRHLPVEWITYNIGSVDSVAILPYLLGQRRHADDWTSFLFHGVSWTFGNSGETASSQVQDAVACITTYEEALTGITAQRAGMEAARIRDMRLRSTVVPAAEAVRLGLATAVAPFAIPQGGRWWQV